MNVKLIQLWQVIKNPSDRPAVPEPSSLTTDMNSEMCLFIHAHFSAFSQLADFMERADGDRYI